MTAAADGLLDSVRQAATSDEGKALTNKAVDASKGAAGKALTGKRGQGPLFKRRTVGLFPTART